MWLVQLFLAAARSQLLRVDPTRRATAASVLSHPWIQGAVSSVELSFTLAQMRLFQQRKREILRCGFLVKQGALVRNFKRRVFVLTSDELSYYDPDDLPPALLQHLQLGGAASGGGGSDFDLRWITDLKARPRGSIRLQGVAVVATQPLPAAGCPKFPAAIPVVASPPSGGGSSARSSSTDVPSLSAQQLARSGAPEVSVAALSVGGQADVQASGGSSAASRSDTAAARDAAAPSVSTRAPCLVIAGREGGDVTGAATLVPCTAAGEFRWGLRLTAPPSLIGSLAGRDYFILADSAAARDSWLTAVSTVHLRGDLVRRAGVAMAMGDAHVKDAVGLMRMAQEWQDAVMSAPQEGLVGSTGAPGSPGGSGSPAVRRRRRQSRHPPPDGSGRLLQFGRVQSATSDAGISSCRSFVGHAKVCKHSSSSDLRADQPLPAPEAGAVDPGLVPRTTPASDKPPSR